MKTLLMFIVGCVISMWCTAQSQSTTVKILDIAVNPMVYVNNQTPPSSSDSTDLLIQFKISDVSQSANVKILLGTTQDLGDVLTLQPNIVLNGSNYYLDWNVNQTLISNHCSKINVRLSSQQFHNTSFITIYVKDNNGLDSNKLYFKF